MAASRRRVWPPRRRAIARPSAAFMVNAADLKLFLNFFLRRGKGMDCENCKYRKICEGNNCLNSMRIKWFPLCYQEENCSWIHCQGCPLDDPDK